MKYKINYLTLIVVFAFSSLVFADDKSKLEEAEKSKQKGKEFVSEGKKKDAIKEFEKCTKLNPQDNECWSLMINNLEEKDKLKKYKDMLKYFPNDAEIYFKIATNENIYGYDGISEFRKAIELDPQNPKYHYEFANKLAYLFESYGNGLRCEGKKKIRGGEVLTYDNAVNEALEHCEKAQNLFTFQSDKEMADDLCKEISNPWDYYLKIRKIEAVKSGTVGEIKIKCIFPIPDITIDCKGFEAPISIDIEISSLGTYNMLGPSGGKVAFKVKGGIPFESPWVKLLPGKHKVKLNAYVPSGFVWYDYYGQYEYTSIYQNLDEKELEIEIK